jgi:Flp pilus assembly protein TadG
LRPLTWKLSAALRRRRDDERGAEMVEFAFVVVLLVALLYGIITYGLILAAQATVTQAAADAARSGIVNSSSAVNIAGAQANTDIGWMGKGTCYQPNTTPVAIGSATAPISCTASQGKCPSNPNNQCLTVTVLYNYAQSPLFPELPGLGVITPSVISSTNVLQLSTPSS